MFKVRHGGVSALIAERLASVQSRDGETTERDNNDSTVCFFIHEEHIYTRPKGTI
jgi:hypothetical protein